MMEKPENIGNDIEPQKLHDFHEQCKEDSKIFVIGFCHCYIFTKDSYYEFPNISFSLEYDQVSGNMNEDIIQKYFSEGESLTGIMKVKSINVTVGTHDEYHQQKIVDALKESYFAMETGERMDMTDAQMNETLELME